MNDEKRVRRINADKRREDADINRIEKLEAERDRLKRLLSRSLLREIIDDICSDIRKSLIKKAKQILKS